MIVHEQVCTKLATSLLCHNGILEVTQQTQ